MHKIFLYGEPASCWLWNIHTTNIIGNKKWEGEKN